MRVVDTGLTRPGEVRIEPLRPAAPWWRRRAVRWIAAGVACALPALDRLLSAGPHVREGGVLVFLSPLAGPDGGADPIHALLAARHYDVERCLRGAHRELHVARRRSRTFRKAA